MGGSEAQGRPEEQLARRILQATDLVALSRERTALVPVGANFKGSCPFCKKSGSTFCVSAAKQFYFCFGCGKKGDALRFLRDLDQLPLAEAMKVLATRSGVSVAPTETGSDPE